MPKTFSQLMDEVGNPQVPGTGQDDDENQNVFTQVFGEDGAGALVTPGGSPPAAVTPDEPIADESGSLTPSLFTDVFGADGENARYAGNEETQDSYDDSRKGQFFRRLRRNLQQSGAAGARDLNMQLRGANEDHLDEIKKQIAVAEDKVRANPENPQYQTTYQQLLQAADAADKKNRKLEALIAQNGNTVRELAKSQSPASEKFFNADFMSSEMLEAVGEDGFGIIGDVLAQNSVALAANAVTAVATRGRSVATKVGAQVATESGITSMQEFTQKLTELYPDGQIDDTDPDQIRKIFENKEALLEAYNTSAEGGGIAAVGSALSTLLAVKGIIPMKALMGKPASRIASEVAAQSTVQGGIGAGTEAALAANAGRDISAGELVAGGVLGVASGAIDSVTSAGNRTDVSQPEAVAAEIDAPEAAAVGDTRSALDEIYAQGDREVASMDIPKVDVDEATSNYRRVAGDSESTPEQVQEAYIAAVSAQKDFDAQVEAAREAPATATPETVETQIETAARSTPDDDPQLMAYREKRDGPKSEFDVPESDPRYSAAQDLEDEGGLLHRAAARDRFDNPGDYSESRQVGDGNEVRQGVDQDLGRSQGRSEGQPGDGRRNEEEQYQQGSVEEDLDQVRMRERQQQSAVEADDAQGLQLSDSDRRAAQSPGDPNSPLNDLNDVLANAVTENRSKNRQAIDAEVDRLSADSDVMFGLNDPSDLPAGPTRDQVEAMERTSDKKIIGVYDRENDKIYMFKDRLQSPKQARDFAIHEASHFARSDTRDNANNIRQDVLDLHDALGGHDGVMKYAKDNGIDLSFYEQRYAQYSDDMKAFLMTDELLATVHGNEAGELKQLSRRALSKIENMIQDFTGQELDLFKRTGGRSEIDGRVMRMIAEAERSMRRDRVMGTKYGVVAASESFNPADSAPVWMRPDWMPNVVSKMRDTDTGINMAEWWRVEMRTDGGLGQGGQRARVKKDSALAESNIKVHHRLEIYRKNLKNVPAKDREQMNRRLKNFLGDRNDPGSDLPREIRAIAMTMRRDIDEGSMRVHNRVLTEQLQGKTWKLLRSDPEKYSPAGEDNLVKRLENWTNKPQDRDDPDLKEYFDMIPDYMRDHIDLMETVKANMGGYLRTSFRAYNDKTYAGTVLSNKPLVEEYAADIIAIDADNSKEAKLVESLKDKHTSEIGAQEFDKAKATDAKLQTARKALADRTPMEMTEARAILAELLENPDGIPASKDMIRSGNVMGIGKQSFKKKTLEDPRLKKILGEYTDVASAYAQSMNTLDSIHSAHVLQREMLTTLTDLGLVSETRSRDEIANDPIQKPLMESDDMAVLNGLYTTPAVEKSLTFAMDGFQLSENKIKAGLVTASAAVNYGKTILSPPTHVVNATSNLFISAANGHMFGNPDKGSMREDIKFFKDVYMGDEKALNQYREYTRLSIAGETVDVNELADILGKGDSATRKKFNEWIDDPTVMSVEDVVNTYEDSVLGGVVDATKLTMQQAARAKRLAEFLYGAEDDIFKIRAFRSELAVAKKYKGLQGDEANQWAAQRVRDGYLMYGELNKLVKEIKNAPGIGVFVSFPAALIKATKGQIRMAAQDLFDEDLPKWMRVRRTVGMGMAHASTATLAGVSAAMTGIGDTEEDEWRKTLPKWARQNDIMFLGRTDNGDPLYIDISRPNPYTYFKTGIRELLKSNDDSFLGVNTNLFDMAHSFGSPFYGTNILTTAIAETVFDVDFAKNRRITNPALSNEAQGQELVTQFALSVMPGFGTQLVKIHDAASNDKKWYGSENSFGKASMSMFGLNVGRIDRDVSLRFFTSSMQKELGNAGAIVTRAMGDQSNPATYEDIRDSLFARRSAEMKLYKDALKMVKVSKELGLDDTKIRSMMKAYRVSDKVVAQLLRGEMPTPRVSGREGGTAYKTALAMADSAEEKREVELERLKRLALLRKAEKEWLASDNNLSVVE